MATARILAAISETTSVSRHVSSWDKRGQDLKSHESGILVAEENVNRQTDKQTNKIHVL